METPEWRRNVWGTFFTAYPARILLQLQRPSLQNKAFATSLDVLEHISAIGKDWLARAHKSKKMI
jgi:hypothetical protein